MATDQSTGLDSRPAPHDGPSGAEMRRALGHFASGVTIVTGAGADGPVGFACQSFASVSLDPPLVLFCADHRGRAWPIIRAAGVFTVNVLAADQIDLCMRFGSRDGAKFRDLDWTASPWGSPSFPETIVQIHAKVETVYTAGDHDVIIGRVLSLSEADADARPLLFYRGRFGLDDGDPSFVTPITWGWDDHWW
ncbi:monooxygenase [Acrocarpospora pleiomorpha]|uniref:Monooxygenase n=2 Tax=Acrocarpospora pleiomorpha TaxID=90975 RepID=A0A5M3Y1X5_9ACTN|nr:monooxygenase [Acrocarpospora pleiomorpha]